MNALHYIGPQKTTAGSSSILSPGTGEVRLKVSYCGVCGTDLHIYEGKMDQRITFPHVMGHEASGVIDEVGSNCGDWKSGDRVVIRPLLSCGTCHACRSGHSHVCYKLKFLGIDRPGAFQEHWNVPSSTLHRIPDSIPDDLAALAEPLAVACHDVRRSGLVRNELAVVIGAGPIGMLIGTVVRLQGGIPILCDINPERIRLAQLTGLEVINSRDIDFELWLMQRTGDVGADLVFEVSGSPPGARLMTQILRVRGRAVLVGIFPQPVPVDLFRFFWRELILIGARVYEPEDFAQAIELLSQHPKLFRPVITSHITLDELPKALNEAAHGKVMMKTMVQLNPALSRS